MDATLAYVHCIPDSLDAQCCETRGPGMPIAIYSVGGDFANRLIATESTFLEL